MKIGSLEVCGNLVLAPMAGYTDAAFRSLCREQGAALTYTEMISAKALYYKNKNTKPLLQVAENEGPVALQLFGNDPELLAQEALKLQDGPYEIFDVNMACPVPKVVNNGEGSALMLDPKRVGAIVKTMTDRLKKPVSVKIRKGFDDEHVNAVEIAKIAQDNGASMVAVHGRTRVQMYHGKADYEIIRQVKEALDIPVFGSGDIYTREDALRMFRETGVDAVMAARGTRGNPWIFREILDPGFCRPSLAEVKKEILKQLGLMIYYSVKLDDSGSGGYPGKQEITDALYEGKDQFPNIAEGHIRACIRQMRKHVGFYTAGYANSAAFRGLINRCETLKDFLDTLSGWT